MFREGGNHSVLTTLVKILALRRSENLQKMGNFMSLDAL